LDKFQERHGNKVLVVSLPYLDFLLPTLVISDNDRSDIVRDAVVDYFSGSLVKEISRFIVSFSMKLQDASRDVRAVALFRHGPVFRQLLVVELID